MTAPEEEPVTQIIQVPQAVQRITVHEPEVVIQGKASISATLTVLPEEKEVGIVAFRLDGVVAAEALGAHGRGIGIHDDLLEAIRLAIEDRYR